MKEKIEEIYNKFSKPLLYFILKHVSNKSLAEDLLHEVFIKAYKNIESLEDKSNIQAWLYKIASNTIIDYYRKNEMKTVENYE
jgi:RNA polymerase sigma-70 factor (ECF subfamily)